MISSSVKFITNQIMILRTFISECRNLLNEVKGSFIVIQIEQKTSQAKKNIMLPVVVAGLIVFASACTSSSSQPQSPPPPTVSVSAPLEEAVTQYDEYTGRFRAVERVEVRARVDGYLQEIRFTDGELV